MPNLAGKAPRLCAYLEHLENRPLLIMRRSEWNDLELKRGKMVEIDLRRTPLKGYPNVEAAIAERTKSGEVYIKVYRIDENDAPKIINEDIYAVWEFVPKYYNLPQIVTEASTEINPNLTSFLEECIFLIKQKPGPNHWLTDLPEEIILTIMYRYER
ncbi:hypothetical protein GF340_01255 [Candidatus Peregrinibacteria bacterium]|nr:hypothetical protein [Candidatus Peregrinibacteria bacterium]